MSFGGQTISIIQVTENPAVRDHYRNPQKLRTETAVRGCHFRPLSAEEVIAADLGDKVTEVWKATLPPAPAVLDAKAHDEIKVDGVVYQLVGPPRVHRDFIRDFKVTLIAARYQG